MPIRLPDDDKPLLDSRTQAKNDLESALAVSSPSNARVYIITGWKAVAVSFWLVFLFFGTMFCIGATIGSMLGMISNDIASRNTYGSAVNWKPCSTNPKYFCGSIKVPKDYYDESVGKAKIELLKVPATVSKKDRKGTIWLNPGGPGGSGVSFANSAGSRLSELVLGHYDFIGFDPRGIGATEPRVECFNSTLDFELFKSGTVLDRGFDLHPDPESPERRERLTEQHRERMAMQEAAFTKCGEMMGNELKYMSTSTVVRDIEYMTEKIEGKDGKINYFGGSYGTILGAYLVNMVNPDKIGRVIIDGVASAPQWANDEQSGWLADWLVNTETTYKWFLEDCHRAGPRNCPLAKSEDKDYTSIRDRLDAFLDDLYFHPRAVPDAIRPGILTSGIAREQLYASTNQPGVWPFYAKFFALALEGNLVPLMNQAHARYSDHTAHRQTDLSRAAVGCADSPPYKSREDFPTAEKLTNATYEALKTSPRFGASIYIIEPDGGCEFWPAAGKTPERFTGPWNATLKTPMLIISNTADPITPLASGRELNKLMGTSSRLLIQNSPGHCSLGSVSSCTAGHWRRYFLEGKLPEDETVCEIDQGYFPGTETHYPSVAANSQDYEELKTISKGLAEVWADFAKP